MGTNLIRAMLLATAGAAVAIATAPTAAYAQEATYQIDIPAQLMADALRALGKATKQNIVFNGAAMKGKRSAAVRGRMTASEALGQMLAGSGLALGRGSGGGFTVVKAGNGAAPTSAPRSAVERVPASQRQGRGTIIGTVRDQASGASLKGALVELVGTGRSTSTDDLGAFRFVNAPEGDVTVRISYLGYAEQQSTISVGAGETYAEEFTLVGSAGGQEIVVYGRRSARAQSLNEERSAENSTTVLASDFLGQFDGETISEALRRAPGVAFEQDEVTGDGTNVIVRGLAPDLNTVTFNGLRLPEGSGTERSASLGNILTESIAKITINKTVLPSQDSSGTGGLIEIETKGPLDRPRRFASLSVSRSTKEKGFRNSVLASGTFSATLGAAENFGLSLSAQYREQSIKRISYGVSLSAFNTKFLPLSQEGTPLLSPSFIDPRTAFPFDSEASSLYPNSIVNSFNGAETTNLTLSASAQLKIKDHTELRLDFTRAEDGRDSFTRSATITPYTGFVLMPVTELGGEIRAVRVAEDIYAEYGLPGVLLGRSQEAQIERDRKDTTQTLSFQGETNISSLQLKYTLGYARGETITPYLGRVGTSTINEDIQQYLLPEALADLTSNGKVISPFAVRRGKGFPLPLLSADGFESFSNDRFFFGSVQTGSAGKNDRYTANLSTRYSLNSSVVKYIEAGLFYEDSKFSSLPISSDERLDVYALNSGNGPPISDLGLSYSRDSLSDIGLVGGFNVLDRDDVDAFLKRLRSIAQNDPALLIVQNDFDARLQKTFTNEQNVSAYFQLRGDIGKLEVVGGIRYDRIRLKARNLTSPGITDENFESDLEFAARNTTLIDQVVSQNQFLPRFAATYRHNENLLVRAGFATTVARPRIQDLSDQSFVGLFLPKFFGPANNQPALYVTQGNPDLRPARTMNFDLSLEKYFSNAGQIKFSVFYKSISNLLEQTRSIGLNSIEGVVLPDDERFQNLPSDIFIEVTKPVNSPDRAKIWGVEAAFEKQLTFLPGPLSGLGLFANYTYTDSSKTQPFVYYDPITSGQLTARIQDIPFSGAPRHSGTASVTYNKYGIDATLAYTMQSRRLESFAAFGLSAYDERDDSLDFRAEYRFGNWGGMWRIWIEGSDLLKDAGDPDVENSIGGVGSTPKFFTGGNYFGGRTVSVGLSATF